MQPLTFYIDFYTDWFGIIQRIEKMPANRYDEEERFKVQRREFYMCTRFFNELYDKEEIFEVHGRRELLCVPDLFIMGMT